MATDLPSSKSLRAGYAAANIITGWDNEKRPCRAGYPPQDVRMHAVENRKWQVCRLSMKGKTTTVKLTILENWWDRGMREAQEINDINRAKAAKYAVEVQVGNYLGALKRGGQLNDDNQIRKEM